MKFLIWMTKLVLFVAVVAIVVKMFLRGGIK